MSNLAVGETHGNVDKLCFRRVATTRMQQHPKRIRAVANATRWFFWLGSVGVAHG